MAIIPDTSGFRPEGDAVWADQASGDLMSAHFFDLVPTLPAGLGDLPRLRYELAMETAEVGGLVEAFVVTLDGVPALLQVVKVPLPDRPGQVVIASITVPKATSSAVLKLIAFEGPMTGARESLVVADTIQETGSIDAFYGPHPYAPQSRPKLPWIRADDPALDPRFPDHPLSRARRWLRHTLATARLDPEFAALPPFGTPVSVSIGLPIGPFLPLWTVDEKMTFWRLRDADTARAQLGRGGADRRSINHTESCEAAWLHPAHGVLSLSTNLPPVQVAPVSDETAYTSLTSAQIMAAFDWIGELSVASADRAEMLMVRTAATADGADKYVLMSLQVDNGDRANPSCVVETSPVPVSAELWDTVPPLPTPDRAGFARTRNADQARVDARLTLSAVQTWDVHPFRLMLSYKPNPDLR
ncbi:hypothetical protein [Amycolatopsis sp. H20-H5]|uniref:hypothetical protein n=1 Tax=Amycolatopsis sp. H20-H5 TaxID=3046309 RepID=UPI002DB6DDF5|nr:hypothetical protein [Amycolatopsis sp. H20-H5]MEC3978287.1 hypothetical protein [Amycolatopsis sp. H20-H5]